jgi:hypothetical protein
VLREFAAAVWLVQHRAPAASRLRKMLDDVADEERALARDASATLLGA